jgi:quinol-cytochrome oxidoreductase complex cytochrome b subunit
VDSKGDKIPFYPYFVVKDLFAFFCFLTFFGRGFSFVGSWVRGLLTAIPAAGLH